MIISFFLFFLLFLIRAVCRDETKEGVCPKLNRNQYASCTEDCGSDADCGGEQKCCFNGCGRSCLEVVKDAGAELLPPGEGDGREPPVEIADPNAPNIQVLLLDTNIELWLKR